MGAAPLVAVGTALPTMPRWAETIEQQLRYIADHGGVAQRHAFRARLVVAVRAGGSIRAVAAAHHTTRATVGKWVTRVAEAGTEGLLDAARPGRPRLYDDDAVRDLLVLITLKPPRPRPLWTHTLLAEAMGRLNWGVTASWVTRTLRTLGLKVHRVVSWLHRRDDPDFDARVAAVQEVITAATQDPRPVLSVDEKTAYSVRTPVMADTRGGDGVLYREFEYIRRGAISWYGVQEAATGDLTMLPAAGRMDSAAFTDVLAHLVDTYGEVFTLVMDNGPAHTSRHTRAWLDDHPGITVVYTPVHASWVNPIESIFGILARQVLKHGWFEDPADCDAHVQAWVTERNREHHPVRFTWQPAA